MSLGSGSFPGRERRFLSFMDSRRIIHIVGPSAAGKSTPASSVQHALGWPVVAMDDFIMRELPDDWRPRYTRSRMTRASSAPGEPLPES